MAEICGDLTRGVAHLEQSMRARMAQKMEVTAVVINLCIFTEFAEAFSEGACGPSTVVCSSRGEQIQTAIKLATLCDDN